MPLFAPVRTADDSFATERATVQTTVPVQTFTSARSTPAPNELQAMKNALITTVSTFLGHYFTPQFLQGRWFLWDFRVSGNDTGARSVTRKVLEMKARFLYCVRLSAQELLVYPGDFQSLSAFEEDQINDALEITSTPERAWMDILLNRCTDVMTGDMSGIELSEGKAGQFLRRVLRMVRNDLREAEHIKFIYLFCVWKFPDVLFEPSIGNLIRKREIRALLNDPRVPKDLVDAFRDIRGGGLFGGPAERAAVAAEPPVDEGWDIELARTRREPERDGAWRRLFSRRKKS